MAVQQVLPFGDAAISPPRRGDRAEPAATRLRLHYSNRTERLLESLIASLEAARARPGANLFDPATIIVPNRQIETYLRFGIARARGIAASLETRFLRDFLEEVIEKCRPDVRIVAGNRLRGLILTLLSDRDVLTARALASPRDYLFAAGEDPDVVDLRAWQLSGQIAHLFEEYDYSRPEMVEAWAAGHDEPNPAGEPDARRWQRALWEKLWGPSGLVQRRSRESGQTWLTAPAAFCALRTEELARTLPREIHVFGISYAARAFHEIFARLSRAADVHLYSITPCVEFREELEASTGQSPSRLPSRDDARNPPAVSGDDDPYGLTRDGETPALRFWGRPARENIRLLAGRVECELDPCFEVSPEKEPTLLRQLQRDILAREPECREVPVGEAGRYDGDRSLRVFQCPGVRRELETIAAEIWSLLEADEAAAKAQGRSPLRLNDIAVILPSADLSVYHAHAASVFGEAYDIPYNLVDLSLSAESRLAEAASLLLELPLGNFTRQDVLRVATHPCVIGRFPDADPREWLDWCDALGIFHGADHDDHCDTYIERDLCNWDQGIRRLALGAFMAGRGSGEDRVYESGGERYLPEEIPSASLESAAGFAALVRSLIEDARFARGRTMPVADWIRYFRALFQSCFRPQGEEDERDLLRCLAAVQALEELELSRRAVGYRIPCEFLRAELSSLSGGRGQYLADGVVVSSFLPMRAIPFRVIFIAGLGEGKFPAPDNRNALDLRQARRLPGDVSTRERDKSMFLETLLCARERLILSYVSRDSLTGDPISPSSVIRELEHFLERGYLGEKGFEKLVTRFRLRRYEEPADRLDWLAPAARAESQAQGLGTDLRKRLGDQPMPRLADLPRSLSSRAWSDLEGPLALPPVRTSADEPPVSETSPVERISLSISALRRFLECPLQGSAKAYLKLREDDGDEDLLTRKDEALTTAVIPRIMLLRAAFVEALAELAGGPSDDARRAAAFAGAYERRAAILELEGKLPTGIYGAAERDDHLGILEQWWRVYPFAPSRLKVYRFGRAEEHEDAGAVLDPVVLDGVALGARRARIEIYGRTDPVVEEAPGSLIMHNHRSDGFRRQKDSLRAFFDEVLLAASGTLAGKTYRACLVLADPEKGPIRHEETFDPMTPAEARSYLTMLCQEMLRGGNDRLFPCEAVFRYHEDPSHSLAEYIEGLRESREPASFRYGPVPRPASYPSLAGEEALETVGRRFGLYFQKRRSVSR